MQNFITLRTPHFFVDELTGLLARDAIFPHKFSYMIFTLSDAHRKHLAGIKTLKYSYRTKNKNFLKMK